MSKTQALKIIGLGKSSLFYRTHPRPPVGNPTPSSQRAHPHRLGAVEQQRIWEMITDPRYASMSIRQVFYDLYNSGVYLGSLRSFHRVAARYRTSGDATDRATTTSGGAAAKAAGVPSHRPVTVTATKPGQIVCWDVTFLPHVFTGSRFAACVFVDLYSRQIIGFEVGYRESAAGASALCRTVIDRVAAAGGRVCVLHSDNGSVMTSTQVAGVCEDHRVVQSFIRPRVSNDNAHVESLFGTVKTRLDYPVVFEDVEHARRWVAGFVAAYNDTGHSGLAGYTPNQVADGWWDQVYQRRVAAKQAYDQAHPSRVPARPAGVGTVPDRVELVVYSTKGAGRDGEGLASLLVR